MDELNERTIQRENTGRIPDGELFQGIKNNDYSHNKCRRQQDMVISHRNIIVGDISDCKTKTIDRHRTWVNNNILYSDSMVRKERKQWYSLKRDVPTNDQNVLSVMSIDECVDMNCDNSIIPCRKVICGRGTVASFVRSAPRPLSLRGVLLNKCWFNTLLVFVLVLMFSSRVVQCARTHTPPEYIDDNVQNYLTNFGYLPESGSEAGNLRTEDHLRDAIRNLQKFGHIPATGKVDERTVELLKKPRCGLPDHYLPPERRRRRFVQQGAVWNHTNLTWSLQKKSQNLDVNKVRAELSRALAVWSDHSKLTFTEINSDKADIVISFAKRHHDDNHPFDGKGQILAHAFFPGPGRGGDAHFDDDEIWLLSDASEDDEGTSLFAVAAHEFGHSLGLSHSPVKGALMYPWYQGFKPNFELPEDDRLGIQNMYGVKESRMWGKIPVFPTEPTETTTEQRPQRPRWPQHPERPYYPRHRPTHPPRHPNYPDERKPEPPRRPEYPERRPGYYPERNPYYPERRPEYNPPRVPERPVYTTTTTTPKPRPPERRPDEYPDRRKYYPDSKYPEGKPYYPHHPHTTPRSHHPHTTESTHHKPDHPRKHHPKKPYHIPEKPWKEPERKPVEPTPETHPKPDTCNTNYDAVALIRGEVFIFKDQYLWRIGDTGVMDGFPTFIHRMWGGLPSNLSHVDAVYERPDKKIVFFIGKQFYVFNGNRLEWGYPRPLTDLGLPSTLQHLNAAMVWGHNGKTYFYNETMYWKYDEDEGKVELDYPRDMGMWKGVGYNIDSVFQWKDGKTYFFKGKGFWKFNDLHMKVEHEKQRMSAQFWMGCPYPDGDEDMSFGNKQPYQGLPPSPTSTFDFTGGSATMHSSSALILLAISLYIILSNVNLT